MKRILGLLILLGWGTALLANPDPAFRCKVLFIPLDDRPPCLQFPLAMSKIGQIELISPPRELLGRFTTPGQCEEILAWIKSQALEQFDAAIVSLDMLAYGGLVASRIAHTPLDRALQRAAIIRYIKSRNPRLRMYGSSVIMRLAPTADGTNEAYREKLAKWAEISPDPTQGDATRALEKVIPTSALQQYQNARQRNLQLNTFGLQLLQEQVLDYLILSQDDAKPRGVHVKEREQLLQAIQAWGVQDKVALQPGADEVSMLLLARIASDQYQYHPKVKVIYASAQTAQQVMPFEDRSLQQTVQFHLKAVGAEEVSTESAADLLFFVFADRFSPGAAVRFAELIQQKARQRKWGLILADVDPRGDVQGGDTTFTETLQRMGIFAQLYGYACWNTAGNTIGTALPHGFIYGMTQSQLQQIKAKRVLSTKAYQQLQSAIQAKQYWFTLNRLLDDYTYHSIVRPPLLSQIQENQWNAFRLSPEQRQHLEDVGLQRLQPLAQRTLQRFFGNKRPTPPYYLDQLRFSLPWNRTFEAEIDFALLASKPSKP